MSANRWNYAPELLDRVLRECRALMAAGVYPSPAELRERIPGRSQSTLLHVRMELLRAGLIDRRELAELRAILHTDQQTGEWDLSPAELQRRCAEIRAKRDDRGGTPAPGRPGNVRIIRVGRLAPGYQSFLEAIIED